MSLERNKLERNSWQPTASIKALKKRAEIIKKIRAFFYERHVFEVETPLMGKHTITDPFIQGIPAQFSGKTYYLQTSPEYFMKRLLVAGSGDIFQLNKCFRDDEVGRLHNPEFTMLEWYRLGFDHHQMMDDVEDLLELILHFEPAKRHTYQEIFKKILNLDPLSASLNELTAAASHIDCPDLGDDRDAWLQILFTECIEPQLKNVNFIYDFPASQASLARLSAEDPRVAHRFELYINGIELGNGFYELTDAVQQHARFNNDNRIREHYNLPKRAIDTEFLSALAHGLPDCSGVALGIDRLIMIALNQEQLSDVLTFSAFENII